MRPPAAGETVPAEGPPGLRLAGIWRGLVWSGLAALVAAVALGVWGDWRHLAAAFGRFSWIAFPIALLLTLVNASLRFLKWQYYVHRIGARPALLDSVLIFVAGFALSVTPGKTGEFLKAYLLARRCGAPAWKAAPITLAERATDGFAVLVLAGAGLTIVTGSPWWVAGSLVVTVAGCAALALLASWASPGKEWRVPGVMGQRAAAWVERLAQRPAVARLLARLRLSGEGASAILDARSLLLAVALGTVSWGAESIALWNALVAFGLPATVPLLGSALAALNAGTLVGAFSLLPGGAGAAEATIAAVLVQHVDREVAAAATLLIRLCTVWFGAILGIGALLALKAALVPEAPPARPVPSGAPLP
jgi:uncharacterized protein (TIRG00374 family)